MKWLFITLLAIQEFGDFDNSENRIFDFSGH